MHARLVVADLDGSHELERVGSIGEWDTGPV